MAPGWLPLEGAGSVGPGTFRALALGGVELVVANVDGTVLAYRDRCAACDAALRDGALAGPAADMQRLRQRVRPAARGPRGDRRRRRSSTRCRCCGGTAARTRRRWPDGRWRRHRPSGACGSCRRRAHRRRPPRPPRRRRSLRSLRHGHRLRAPAPAAPRRSAHPLLLRALLRAARGRCGAAAVGHARPAARRLRARRRSLGEVPDPDRARVLHGARARAGRARALPEPRGRDRERAAPGRLGRARGGRTPCSRSSSPRSRR